MGQSSKEFDVIVSGPADVIPPNEAIPGKEYQCASIFAYVHRYIPTYMLLYTMLYSMEMIYTTQFIL